MGRPGAGEVYPPAAADDLDDAAAVVQEPDVGQRIAVEHQHVGQAAFGDGADPAFEPHGDGPVGGGADDGLHGAEAQLLHEDLRLPAVPVTVGGEGEPGLGAAQQRHAGVVGRPHHLGGGGDLAPEDVLHPRSGPHGGAEVRQVGQEREGGAEGAAGGDDRLEPLGVHERGVQQHVHAGLRAGCDALGAAAVRHHRGAELVRGVAHRPQLVAAPAQHLAGAPGQQPGSVDLDPVGAVLDVPAGPHDGLVEGVDHLGVAHHALVGDEPPGGAADRGDQGLHAGADARAGGDTRLDSVAQRRPHREQRVGVAEGGDARPQNLGEVLARHQRGGGGVAVEEELVVGLHVVEGGVAVGVDEPRHHRPATGVDALGAGPGGLGGARPHHRDVVAAQQHAWIGARRRAGGVDESAAGDEDLAAAGSGRLVAGSRCAHGSVALGGRWGPDQFILAGKSGPDRRSGHDPPLRAVQMERRG